MPSTIRTIASGTATALMRKHPPEEIQALKMIPSDIWRIQEAGLSRRSPIDRDPFPAVRR